MSDWFTISKLENSMLKGLTLMVSVVVCMGLNAQTNKYFISANIGRGISFQENFPQSTNGYNRRQLYARVLNDNFVRVKVQKMSFLKEFLGLSFGLNYGETNYTQPIFNSSVGIGAYNRIIEYFHFSRNYFSAFLGLSGNLSFYDGAVLLQGGIHLGHSRFINPNRNLGMDDFIISSGNAISYKYSLEIKDNNAAIIADMDLVLKFRLSKQLYLNFGINYTGGRKMEYDYYYKFKTYTASTNTWTEPTTHKNFRHIEQPRRIDHVFYLHTGISYAPNFQRKKKE